MSAVAGPSTGGFSGKPANRSRYAMNQQKYGTPLPILLPSSPLHPAYVAPVQGNKQAKGSYLSAFVSTLSVSLSDEKRAIVPRVKGVFDPVERCVIVEDREDMDILFQRGFFGKGTLSRSEPTWRERRLDILKGGESSAAEKIREKRRLERKQFKIDRAQAMLDAAKAAEAVIVTGQTEQPSLDQEDGGDDEDEEEAFALAKKEAGDTPDGRSSPTLTTASTAITDSAIDLNTLTAQTFLVRPTRPETNRNRGKKAFKRRPPPQTPATDPAVPAAAVTVPVETPAQPEPALQRDGDVDEDEDDDGSASEFDEDIVQEMEVLHLSLEEAWFLSVALGVLRIHDKASDSYIPANAILSLFISPPSPTSGASTLVPRLLPDDPFLVSYVCYHHFRSLGWVVKSGVKFCTDWLLYKKGPVFSHAAFSLVMIPVYSDEEDRKSSPYSGEDWYGERISWKWMNTIMRVNSLVQKTVILVYITIPSMASFPQEHILPNGSLDMAKYDMTTLLPKYTIREVVLSRFGPARRRD